MQTGSASLVVIALLTRISLRSERKIDQIEARLGNIEALLKNISSSAVTDASKFIHTPQTDVNVPTAASNADYDSSDEESALGGDSGLTVHTTFASEFLERAVKRAPLRALNPKMETALANLSQLVEMQKHRSISHGPRFPLQQPVPPGGVSKLPMPPLATVVSLLKHVKCEAAKPGSQSCSLCLTLEYPFDLAAPPTFFTILCTLVGIKDFSDLCRTVYFPTEDFSDATFAVVNTMLYNLFVEQHSLAKEAAVREEYNSYVAICKANLETTLANLPLFLSPKVENVQALLLGVSLPYLMIPTSFYSCDKNPVPLWNRCLQTIGGVASHHDGRLALSGRGLPPHRNSTERSSHGGTAKKDYLLACLHTGQGPGPATGPGVGDCGMRH